MAKNRRRQYFIDRLFQRRFIWLFLMVVFIITVGNVLFYFKVLKPAVESAAFRSHIQVDNPVDIIVSMLRRFVPVMVALVAGLTIGVYTIMRLRLESFLSWMTTRLDAAAGAGVEGRRRSELPASQFQDLEPALLWFLYHVHDRKQRGRRVAGLVRRYCAKPGESVRRELIGELENWEREQTGF